MMGLASRRMDSWERNGGNILRINTLKVWRRPGGGGGALGYFFGGYVPPGTPNWHPVLEKFSPKIDTPL